MFNIGDKVYVPKYGTQEVFVTCPHCFGKKYLTVILGDESKVTIDCECCREGYEHKGKISIWKWGASAEQIPIDGIDSHLENNGKTRTRYHEGTGGCYRLHDEVFATYEEALDFAKGKVAEHDLTEKEEIENKKIYATKTWARNVAYHRDCIKRYEHDLAYHKARLAVAEEKAKEQEERKKVTHNVKS
jgi:hypothetical protein